MSRLPVSAEMEAMADIYSLLVFAPHEQRQRALSIPKQVEMLSPEARALNDCQQLSAAQLAPMEGRLGITNLPC